MPISSLLGHTAWGVGSNGTIGHFYHLRRTDSPHHGLHLDHDRFVGHCRIIQSILSRVETDMAFNSIRGKNHFAEASMPNPSNRKNNHPDDGGAQERSDSSRFLSPSDRRAFLQGAAAHCRGCAATLAWPTLACSAAAAGDMDAIHAEI